MYDILVRGKTSENIKIEAVYLRNKPEDVEKMIRLRDNMIVNGWQGRKVILVDAGDHHIALSGSHRLAACAGLDMEIEAFLLEDLDEQEWWEIESAHDDDALLACFEALNRKEAAEIMRAEVKSNNA
jgi:hypothetical protein